MSTEIVSFSARKTDTFKPDRKPKEFGSHSSRSDLYFSASKSNKAFEDSLRKPDSISQKRQKCNSPSTKQLLFGKSDQEKVNDSKLIYIVDITKKIKKVDSPFAQSKSASETQDNHQISQTNMLVSSFDSISERLQDQVESSNSVDKISLENEEAPFENLALQIKQVLQEFECEESKTSMNVEQINGMIQEETEQKSSNDLSLKSRSSEAIRIRKKEKKIRKRNHKKEMMKQIKEKLKTISEFVDQLHRKESHTKRQDLIKELSKYLHEGKLVRLRNELKKLI